MSYKRTTLQDGVINNSGPFEAIIVSHLDPYHQGTLEVELIRRSSSSGIPERTGQLTIAKYLSPFYGATPASGLKENDNFESTQKSYGFWAVPPDVGSRVLVIFAEGMSAYGYWIGCVQDNNMNMMVPGSTPSTTLHTESTPDDLKDKKLPVGEYNKKIEDGTSVDPQLFKKPYNKDFTEVLQVQGLLDDEARGTTTSSSRREAPSMVFGMNTPGPLDKRENHPKANYGDDINGIDIPYNRLGGSSFVMDDGDENLIRATHAEDGPPIYVNKRAQEVGGDETIPQNELMRFRTRTGHQILMHNSEDLIYIGNARGTTWIEMTSDGKIDIHAQDSVSIMTDTDLNITAERDINMEAGRNVNIKASARWSDFKHFEQDKQSGRVQIESAFDTSHLVGGEHKVTVGTSSHLSVGDDIFSHAGKSTRFTSGSHMYSEAMNGALHLKASQSIYQSSGSNFYNDVAGNYMLTAEGTLNYRAGISVLTNAVESINFTAGTDIFNKTITGSIHNTAETSIFNKTVTGEIHNIAETNIFNQSKTANINSLAELSIFEESGTTYHVVSGQSSYHTTGSNVNIQAAGVIAADAGEIHLNSGLSGSATAATAGVDALLPANAAKAITASNSMTNIELPTIVNPLPEITLPYVLPGVSQPVPYTSIVPRAPQHEPWTHHENLNPLGFKKDQTDRESPGLMVSADRFISPDTFLQSGSISQTSVRVSGSGGDMTSIDIPNEEGNTGDVWQNDEGDTIRVGNGGDMASIDARARGYKPYVPPKVEGYTETDRVTYHPDIKNLKEESGKSRWYPLEPRILQLLDKTATICDTKVLVISAGQMAKSEWRKDPTHRLDRYGRGCLGKVRVRTGSLRHDWGSAADIQIFDYKTGKRIRRDTPRFTQFVEEFFANGGQGIGSKHGYMPGIPDGMHVDIVGIDRKFASNGKGWYYWSCSPEVLSAYHKGVKRRTNVIRSAFYNQFAQK